MEEQNRTAIIYEAQRKMLEANYEMAEIRSLLNELMALEEMEEVIARANAYMAEAELRMSRSSIPISEPEIIPSDDIIIEDVEETVVNSETVAEIVLKEQKRIIAKLLSKGIVPAQIHQWLELPMEMIMETAKEMKTD
jgi:hypothetical protein